MLAVRVPLLVRMERQMQELRKEHAQDEHFARERHSEHLAAHTAAHQDRCMRFFCLPA